MTTPAMARTNRTVEAGWTVPNALVIDAAPSSEPVADQRLESGTEGLLLAILTSLIGVKVRDGLSQLRACKPG
jgi:hypothetical protein